MRLKRNISRSAWDVYEQLCDYGNAKTGVVKGCYVSNARLVKDIGLKLGTVKNARTELRQKGWLEERGGDIHLLVGTFLDERLRRKREAANRSSVSGPPSLSNGEPSPTNDGRIDKERARGITSPYHPSTSPKTNTHTQALGGRAAPREKVCVCGLTVTLELLRRFWRNQTPQPNNIEAMVGKSFDECFRHAQVSDWLERQSAPAEKSAMLNPKDCPECEGRGVYYPEGLDKGVAKCSHSGLYALLAETAQARAHVAT
jgi:hypothetical protein